MSYFLRFDNKFLDFQIRIRPNRIKRASRKNTATVWTNTN